MTEATEKTEKTLINHREVARLLGVTTDLITVWVRRGQFPRPHATISRTMLFPRGQIEHFIEHGTWPDGTEFNGGMRA